MNLRLSGGRKLQSPAGLTARPTPARVRLAVMNILAAKLPGCRWLDLFSGSGVMACEALQRGAIRVVAVEQDRRNAAVVKTNLEAVAQGLEDRQVLVRKKDALAWLRGGRSSSGEEPFDLIYADPPYTAGLYRPMAEAVMAGDWLRPGGELVLECASAALPELPENWELIDQRLYGTTTVLRMQQR